MRMKSVMSMALLGATMCVGAAQAQDWSGFYGGLSIGRGVGDMDYGADGDFEGDFKGGLNGLFAGYNAQNGNMVYGAELAFGNSSISDVDFPEESYEQTLDLKGRVGYAAGRGLYYGVLGYSRDEYYRDGASIKSTGGGVLFGVGVDYMMTDKVFVGAEYLRRNLKNDANVDYIDLESDIDTLSLRVGMKF